MKASKAASRSGGGTVPVGLVLQIVSLALLALGVVYVLGTREGPPAPATSGAGTGAAPPTSPAVKVSTNGYRRIEVGEIAYGDAADQVGLSVQKEARPRGPTSFAVGSDGTIYVADDTNGRIQAYSDAGRHVSSVAVGEGIRDLVVGDASDLLVLASQGQLMAYDRATGQARGRWALEGKPAASLGKLRLTSGSLSMESPQQVTYPLATGSGASLSVLTPAKQEQQSKKGGKAASRTYYSTSYRDGGHVVRSDEQGNALQDISLGLPNVLSVLFLDEDKDGSFYVQVESRADDSSVVVEVWRFDKHGAATAVIPLEPLTYVEMIRSVVVTEAGVVYQAIPLKQGLRLVKWVAP